MKRIIIGFEKLTPDILDLFLQKFPDGYGDDDIIKFNNANGDEILAVEIKNDDTVYLVKTGKRLNQVIQKFDEERGELNEEFFDEIEDLDLEDS
jgi:DNA-directed RNA polymerase subunit delta